MKDLPCHAGDGSYSPSIRSPSRDQDARGDACLELSALPEEVLSQKMGGGGGGTECKAGLLFLNKATVRSSSRQVRWVCAQAEKGLRVKALVDATIATVTSLLLKYRLLFCVCKP